jgi:type I restriction enzyme S subunit
VPKPNSATAEYINFHFLTRNGLYQIGEASPGGAGRNRTLGLEALSKIGIPLPSYEKQLWLGELIEKCRCTEDNRTAADTELNAMLPAILDRAFRGEL